MQFLNYFLASVLSYFGLLIGIILIRIAPEEQKPLEKYFIIMRKLLLLLIFAFLVFYYFKNLIYILLLAACFAVILLIGHRIKDSLKKLILSYAVLGFLFFLGSGNNNLFVIESSLILLYGVPAASLIYNKKNHYKIMLHSLTFAAIANLIYFVIANHTSIRNFLL